ncbi:MAG: alpha/beta hydrolase [Lachnospiraceae bacterium]|nr:alpha/beta hydrolase [Lachnospiraceae bacterium]
MNKKGQCRGTVVICPGGGYEWLSDREAEPVAAAFEKAGWKAEVLRYSVGRDLGTKPLLELGRAVALAKANAPGEPVVVCGFSAGGHLAGSLGVHYQDLGLARPDAMILCYPVITAGAYAHRASINNLCKTDQEYYSLEQHVTNDTPPTFLWATMSDDEVPVQNSLLMAEALGEAGVPYELHIFPKGVHGLSLCTPEVDEPERGRLADVHVARWFALCVEWLETIK